MTGLTARQLDRAQGVLLGTAAGDALGAGYEFGPPLEDDVPVEMNGGGPFNWAPGEWTDDTSMALAIAEVAASGADLRDEAAQDAVADRWAGWAVDASDVGAQTRQVLAAVRAGGARRAGRRQAGRRQAGRRRAGRRRAGRRRGGGAGAGGGQAAARGDRPVGGERLADADRAGGARLPG